MKGIIAAWSDNRSTFGAGNDWPWQRVACYYGFLVATAAALGLVSGTPSDNFFIGTLTALSIIAGFTFNALMFFVDHRFTVQSDPFSLEQSSLQDKLDRLATSSFMVLYYFALVSLIVIIMCIIALVAPSVSGGVPAAVGKHFWFTELVGRFLFFVALIEAMVTFFRVLRRLRYLFGKVREVR